MARKDIINAMCKEYVADMEFSAEEDARKRNRPSIWVKFGNWLMRKFS